MKTTTLALVASVQDTITTLVSDCSKTKKRSELVSLLNKGHESLSSSVTAIGEYKRTLVKTRKSVEVVRNTVEGLLHGLNSDAITLPEFRATCRNIIDESLPRIVRASEAEIEVLPQEEPTVTSEDAPQADAALTQALSQNADWQTELAQQWERSQSAASKAIVKQGEDKAINLKRQLQAEVEEGEAAEFLQRMKQEGRKLPSKLNGGYGVAHLPIVPMFDNIMAVTSAGLKSIGIRHTSMGGYPIFEGQFVLLISKKEMRNLKVIKTPRKTLAKKTDSVKVLPSNQKIELANRPMVDYARSVVEILNESLQERCVLVSERFQLSPRNADHVCFWIMPARKMAALSRITRGAKMTNWSFPFDIDDFRVD